MGGRGSGERRASCILLPRDGSAPTPQLGRSPLGQALWKAPSRSLLMVPQGIWGDEVPPQPFPPLPAPLLPLRSRIQLHAPSRNSCSAWIFNANGLALSAPPSLCLNAAGRAPGWRAGGQGQHVPIVPLSHTLPPPGAGDRQRGEAEGTAPLPVMSCRAAARFPPLIKAALLLHLQHAPLIN